MKSIFLLLTAGMAFIAPALRADDPSVPGSAYPASRYETLWKKSPFAVASAEAVPESPDYMLVGFVSSIEGVSYASLVERQNNEHFLISTDKPVRGLTLTSLTSSRDGTETYAVVQKDGQPITLKLEKQAENSVPQPNMPPVNQVVMPGNLNSQVPMPGASYPGATGARPFPMPRFHRQLIHLPPPPAAQQQQAAPPPTTTQ